MTQDERKKLERDYASLRLQVIDLERVLKNNLPTEPIELCQFVNLLDRKTKEVRHEVQEIGGRALQDAEAVLHKEWSGER